MAKGKGGIRVECSHDRLVSISELVPNPRNPNRHPQKQIEVLAKIIQAQGWRAPITVSERSGFVVRGHGRLEAARLLGLEECPVDFQKYKNEAEEWADLVADNRIAELAEIDDGLLVELMKEIEAAEVEFDLTGFTEKEIRKMQDRLAEKENPTKPEVEFSEELMESSNYIVLYFDNDVDWLQALTLFELKTVKALDSKPGFEKAGIGRVVDGAKAIERIMGAL